MGSSRLPRRQRAVARRAGLVGLAAVSTLLLGGCTTDEVGRFTRLGMPVPVTDRATHTLALWRGAWIAAFCVGALVWGLIIFCAIRYHKRDETPPPQIKYHLPIEMLYTFIPFVMVGVLFYYTVREQDAVLAVNKTKAPQQVITVVGQQWAWTFNYAAKDQVGANVWETGNAQRLPELWLPVGELVEFKLKSPDVIHSFWVPDFLFKMDVFPGTTNSFQLTPTKKGTYIGRCAELCGAYHSKMLFYVHIVSPDQYEAHLRQLKAQGNTGQALGSATAVTIDGLEAPGGPQEMP